MIICHCRVVSAREVTRAIDAGAHSVEEIGERCAAGTHCGGCHPELERLLCERAERMAGAGAGHRPLAGLLGWRHG